jgi:hypothetical protein
MGGPHTSAPDSFEGLPEVLAEVARAAGLEAALNLASHLGGSRVYVAARPRKRNLLVKAVGIEAASKIASIYGGENIRVPQGPAADGVEKTRKIVERLKAGASVDSICRDLRVDRRTVQRHKAKLRASDQADLFDGNHRAA